MECMPCSFADADNLELGNCGDKKFWRSWCHIKFPRPYSRQQPGNTISFYLDVLYANTFMKTGWWHIPRPACHCINDVYACSPSDCRP